MFVEWNVLFHILGELSTGHDLIQDGHSQRSSQLRYEDPLNDMKRNLMIINNILRWMMNLLAVSMDA